MEERVLIFALRGRDASIIAQSLTRQGLKCSQCDGVDQLAAALADGAGTALVTEESLAGSDRKCLSDWLQAQPPWSDFPFILLATKRVGRRPKDAIALLEELGNVIVLERPIHGETLVSAVSSALRSRRKQYEARRRLEELKIAEERLMQLNGTLEMRIDERTVALSRANDKLMKEIAERERAQAALAQSQKMEAVGQLTGGIAHDFNNLLTVVIGNLELIQRRTSEEATERLVGYAVQAADRAAKLTQQLLAFSRSQRLNLQPVDLNALILGTSDLIRRTIGPQISVQMDLDPAAPRAMADTNQLELAILNLVINARDAMPDGGTLKISSAVRASGPEGLIVDRAYGVIQVADTGAGIPAEVIGRVFDPFFTTKPIGKGTGLGLSQVYGMAQQSGGTVTLESAAGQGARIDIWLPLTDQALDASLWFDAADALPQLNQNRRQALLIEDEDGVRRFIAECLEQLNFTVTQAASGPDGLAAFDQRPHPDLVIVDYAMPGMNGVEVVNALRARAPELPIVLATGYADMERVEQVMKPEAILRKPFPIAELEAAIRHVLADAI